MTTKNSVIEEMFSNGTHYGYSKSRRHPSTTPYIFATKNGVDIINTEKTNDLFEKAMEKVNNAAKKANKLTQSAAQPVTNYNNDHNWHETAKEY